MCASREEAREKARNKQTDRNIEPIHHAPHPDAMIPIMYPHFHPAAGNKKKEYVIENGQRINYHFMYDPTLTAERTFDLIRG
jgi:hypothetical protein